MLNTKVTQQTFIMYISPLWNTIWWNIDFHSTSMFLVWSLLLSMHLEGCGVLHPIFASQVRHAKKNWTHSDISFCENEGWKRSKIIEKRGQLDWKSRGKLIQSAYNLLNNTFWWKIRSILCSCISGTICDRDKPFFSAERGDQSDCVEV